jgi:hypothetical protein
MSVSKLHPLLVKKGFIVGQKSLFKLRKAVYKKRQLHNVFKTQRSSKSWEQYRKQRNIVTKKK